MNKEYIPVVVLSEYDMLNASITVVFIYASTHSKQYISLCLRDSLGFSIQENFDENAFIEFGDNNPKVYVSKRSFKELFNNIIMNASRHGFSENRQYLVNINITINEGKLNVSFMNNGKPFAKGIYKQLGVKGKKAGVNAGSGIGVWKIFEISKQYNFECTVIDLPENEFPVGWEFKFLITE